MDAVLSARAFWTPMGYHLSSMFCGVRGRSRAYGNDGRPGPPQNVLLRCTPQSTVRFAQAPLTFCAPLCAPLAGRSKSGKKHSLRAPCERSHSPARGATALIAAAGVVVPLSYRKEWLLDNLCDASARRRHLRRLLKGALLMLLNFVRPMMPRKQGFLMPPRPNSDHL